MHNFMLYVECWVELAPGVILSEKYQEDLRTFKYTTECYEIYYDERDERKMLCIEFHGHLIKPFLYGHLIALLQRHQVAAHEWPEQVN